MTTAASRLSAAASLVLASFLPASAQEVRSAVVGDTILVGDVVPVALRTTLEPGQRIAWPDTLPLGGPDAELENAARVRTRVDTLADGRLESTAVYAITPWRPGEVALPDVEIPVVSGDEVARSLTARLPTFEVASVLPADTAGIEPRPTKSVIGRNWALWPILLAILALLLLVAAGIWWLRRRRAGADAPAAPALPPRTAALAALDQAREAGLVERGEMKEFYTRVSVAVREYLGAVEPAWGEDRTTTELLAAVRAAAGPSTAAGLAPILRSADQVKFARRETDADLAYREWESARSWIVAFRWGEEDEPPDADVGEAA